MGGSDDPSNIIELTVEEHAEAHRVLYETHGKEQDLIAWRGLSGIIPRKEAVAAACSLAGKISNKKRLSDGTHPWLNSETQRNTQLKRLEKGTHNFLNPELREKQKIAVRKFLKENNPVYEQISNGKNKFVSDNPVNKRIICPHCNKEGPRPQMLQWHFDNCKRIK
jgi:hypothetical protein